MSKLTIGLDLGDRHSQLCAVDADGVVVIPQDVAVETIHEALSKLEAEHLTEEELKKGTLLRDVYAKHGVL